MGQLLAAPHFTQYETPVPQMEMFHKRIPIEGDELHLLVPAGVGDNCWIAAKFWSIVQQRQCTFWLPAAEQKRSGDLFRMLGWRYGYLPGLTTNWIWSRPGEPPIPDSGAILSIQPNRHLEHGHRLEKWYPDLPIRNPAEMLTNGATNYRAETTANSNYVVVFMCHQKYMEDGGNLHAGTWARILRHIDKTIGPSLIIGAGLDVEFIEKVLAIYDPYVEPVMNASLDVIATYLKGAEMVIGAHAGPLILSVYLGTPTLQAMPRWLWPMVGTWEPAGSTFA